MQHLEERTDLAREALIRAAAQVHGVGGRAAHVAVRGADHPPRGVAQDLCVSGDRQPAGGERR